MPPEEKQMKGFNLLVGSRTKSAESLLLSKVDPRTCGSAGQGSREWFIDRMFSGTSSTIHSIFKKCIPLLVAEADGKDEEIMNALQTVLSYIDDDKSMDKIKEKIKHDKEKKLQEERQIREKEEEERAINTSPTASYKKEAEEWIKKLSDPQNIVDDDFESKLETMSIATMEWIIALSTASSFKAMTPAGAKKKIKKWLEIAPERRPYQNKKREILNEIGQSKGIPNIKSYKKKDDLIDALINPPPVTNPQNKSANIRNKKDMAPLVELLNQSFLRPQQDKEEIDAAATGHRNEEPFIKSFCQICEDERENESDNLFGKTHVVLVYRPGLVKKKNSSFAKDSADGIIITKEEVSSILFISFVFFFLIDCRFFSTSTDYF